MGDRVDYSAFGVVTQETNAAVGDRFKFTGREYDAGTGLYYYRARNYDPTLQRFHSKDPIGFAAGDANLYRYVGNQPTGGIAPTGTTDLSERAADQSPRDGSHVNALGS